MSTLPSVGLLTSVVVVAAHDWDIANALAAFYVMKGLVVDVPCSPRVSLRKPLPPPLVQGPLKSSSEPSLSSTSSSSASSPCKLAISRTDVADADLLDDVFPKKLSRGISRATDNVCCSF